MKKRAKKGENPNDAPVERLSKDEQIARLIRQRNRLMKLIWELPLEVADPDDLDGVLAEPEIDWDKDPKRLILRIDFSKAFEEHFTPKRAEELVEEAWKITGNLYMSEGVNPMTEDIDPCVDQRLGLDLYLDETRRVIRDGWGT